MLAPENQCSLDERHPVRRVGDAERARDGVGEMPFECYRKGIGYLLGRRYNLPLANVNEYMLEAYAIIALRSVELSSDSSRSCGKAITADPPRRRDGVK